MNLTQSVRLIIVTRLGESMAHKKGQGSSRNGRDSQPKMLGVKLYAGQTAKPGSIILRQRGARFRPGFNVDVGRDFTIFSLIHGKVKFESGKRISVYPAEKQEA